MKEPWGIPPRANAEFVWRMEDALAAYTRPYDPRFPQVCLDELSLQLLADSRPPLPARPGAPAKEDYEYVRRGTANCFMLFEPLRGRREVLVTARRTKTDWAQCIRTLLDVCYPQAERVVLVQDNLNTHSPASLYEAFPPAAAKRLADRLAIHPTPKHGSWLTMAEIELSVLERQCLHRRLPDLDTAAAEVAGWVARRNAAAVTVDWRCTTADARIKLTHLYPVLQPITSAVTAH
ncbi:MAG TPA: IS630 family transposase [Methylomirabilota bacterium]|nr:IS630 family transposase [Methylomirabilota bacterium]